jgi:hypothetical protein
VLCNLSTSDFFAFLYYVAAFLTGLRLTLVQGHQFLVSRPPLPEEGPIQADPVSAAFEAPEANKGQDGDDAKVSLEESSSTTLPPPANSEEPSLDKMRKRLDELLSSSTSTPRNVPGSLLLPTLLKLTFLMLWTREFC